MCMSRLPFEARSEGLRGGFRPYYRRSTEPGILIVVALFPAILEIGELVLCPRFR